MSIPLDERQRRFQEVVAEYLEAVEAGQAESLEALRQRHPDLAEEIITFFDHQEEVARLAGPLREMAAPTPAPGFGPTVALSEGAAEPAGPASSFGDYELLGEIGRGGMGVVYKARQKSLGRLVALKLIRPAAAAGEADARRFRNEAETVALLDHANIVPVHEVGEQPDGLLYFSMKLIECGSLAEQLPRFRDDPRAAAELVAKVARAVHHAHQRGVLHRDLKPANILLDEHGEPHVTDFGLARRIKSDSSITQSGALVGTPSYMSPEQTTGHKGGVTTAADVYGLGAVLYALLSGQPPFRGDSLLETLAQVREREPEPPRRGNAKVDRDLETVCLKCLQKEPTQRYESAGELADDLERWLRREPIRARPVGRAVRLWRWCRRSPRLAGLAIATALLLLVTVGTLAVTTWVVWREKEQTEAALREASQAAARERRQAEQNLGLGFFLTSRTLSIADAYQTGIVTKTQGDQPLATLWKTKTMTTAAMGHRNVGRFAEAAQLLRESLALQEKLAADYPHQPFLYSVHETCSLLGHVLENHNRLAEAEAIFRRGLEASTKLAAAFPAWYAGQYARAQSCGQLFNLLEVCGRPDEAGPYGRQYMTLWEKLATDFPQQVYNSGIPIFLRFGRLLQDRRRFEEAGEVYGRALAQAKALVFRFPEDGFLANLADAWLHQADFLAITGHPQEADKAYRQAIFILEQLTAKAQSSLSVSFRLQELGNAQTRLGSFFATLGQDKNAQKAFAQARAHFESAAIRVKQGMAVDFIAVQVAWTRATCRHPPLHDPRRAMALAGELAARLDKRNPGIGYGYARRGCFRTLGVAQYYAGEWQAAVANLEKSTQWRAGGDSFDWFFLAMAHQRLGHTDRARKWYDQAVQWMDKNRPVNEELVRFRTETAELLGLMGKKE